MPSARASSLNNLFGALADPTRRAIIERLLAAGELSVGDVAEPFDMSAQAVSRHLQVLERAGLIERRIERQWRFVRVRADALEPVESWITRHKRHWTAALDRFEALAAAQNSQAEEVVSGADEGGATLRLERLIPSPREALFALWMQPAQLVKWWAPDGYQAVVQDLDTRPGGRWRISLRRPDGGMATTSGVYRVVEPPRRLVFTWAWEDQGGTRGHESEVSVSFETAPGGTRLVLRHQRFESRQARDRHDAGWSSCFDRQANLVT